MNVILDFRIWIAKQEAEFLDRGRKKAIPIPTRCDTRNLKLSSRLFLPARQLNPEP